MKLSLMSTLVAILWMTTTISCKKPEAVEPVGSLPVQRLLTDKQGREFNAYIVGKRGSTITIVPAGGGAQVEIEIASLSDWDQVFIGKFPLHIPPSPPEAPIEPEKLEIPIERVLKDAKGRELRARIIGNTGAQITILRIDDDLRFDLQISDLSESDQRFVETLEIKSPPPVAEKLPPYIKSRLEGIEKLRLTNERIHLEISAVQNRTEIEFKNREIAENQREIDKLESQIKIYKLEKGYK